MTWYIDKKGRILELEMREYSSGQTFERDIIQNTYELNIAGFPTPIPEVPYDEVEAIKNSGRYNLSCMKDGSDKMFRVNSVLEILATAKAEYLFAVYKAGNSDDVDWDLYYDLMEPEEEGTFKNV